MTNTTGGILDPKISSTKLYFNPSTGTLYATIFNSLSDMAEKINITEIRDATERLININGIEFDWRENNIKSSGVSAQEVLSQFPHLVDQNHLGQLGVNYNGLVGYLVESIKELNYRIKKLES